MIKSRAFQVVYQSICIIFCFIVAVSNFLSAKMVALPVLALSVPAGLITYPLTFLLSDLVVEIFGAGKAKTMVYMSLGVSLFIFGIIQAFLLLPANWFAGQLVFHAFLGLSALRIFSSLISYITSQLVDIQLYAAIKRWTGPRFLWLRNNVSTCVAQIVDTVMIDLIFLWWGLGMTMAEVAPIMLFSYVYKAFFSAACTPFLYLLVFLIRGTRQSLKQEFRFPKIVTLETKGSTL